MDTLEDQMKDLWQTYPQEGNDEAFWQAYEHLQESLPTRTIKIAEEGARPVYKIPGIESLSFKLPAHLKVPPDKKWDAETQDFSAYEGLEQGDLNVLMGFLGMILGLFLLFTNDFGVYTVLYFLIFIASLAFAVFRSGTETGAHIWDYFTEGGNHFLNNFTETHLKVEQDGIERLTWRLKTKKNTF